MIRKFYQTLFILIAGISCFLTVTAKDSNNETNKDFKIRMSPVVNSYQRITAPVITLDGKRLYFDRKLHPENSGGIYDPDEIWYSDRTSRGYMTLPRRDTSGINTEFSDVLFSLSPDGRTALLYGQYDYNDNQKKQGYSISYLLDGKWSRPSPLNINDYYNYSDNFFANLSADSRTLFLSAERFDSRGDLDLYVSFLDSLDNWSKPMNLGKQINTKSTESSPYLAFDGKTLYFSSDRSGGHGALDLYLSRRLDDTYINWGKPENLGSNINSKFDENSICLTAMSDSAYIVSSDTFSLMTGIYQVSIPPKQGPDLYRLVRGKVYVKFGDQKALSGNKTEISVKYEGIAGIRKYYAESGEYLFAIPHGVNALIRAEEHGFEDFVFSVNTKESGRPE
ncbi:MAG: hypothetical protein PF588_01275 [Candidatus Kapabacteria bacterium]|jgi:OOP family OmpA-OmpF porin|nr:hypothetical protein [Candidatus Kapabacteria bacterium]